jgi:hypothetical protein
MAHHAVMAAGDVAHHAAITIGGTLHVGACRHWPSGTCHVAWPGVGIFLTKIFAGGLF